MWNVNDLPGSFIATSLPIELLDLSLWHHWRSTQYVHCTYIIGLFSDFPGRCYSWTSGKWFNPNDTWSLKPFCGAARCVGNANSFIKYSITFTNFRISNIHISRNFKRIQKYDLMTNFCLENKPCGNEVKKAINFSLITTFHYYFFSTEKYKNQQNFPGRRSDRLRTSYRFGKIARLPATWWPIWCRRWIRFQFFI